MATFSISKDEQRCCSAVRFFARCDGILNRCASMSALCDVLNEAAGEGQLRSAHRSKNPAFASTSRGRLAAVLEGCTSWTSTSFGILLYSTRLSAKRRWPSIRGGMTIFRRLKPSHEPPVPTECAKVVALSAACPFADAPILPVVSSLPLHNAATCASVSISSLLAFEWLLLAHHFVQELSRLVMRQDPDLLAAIGPFYCASGHLGALTSKPGRHLHPWLHSESRTSSF